jgi:hypothetical protein
MSPPEKHDDLLVALFEGAKIVFVISIVIAVTLGVGLGLIFAGGCERQPTTAEGAVVPNEGLAIFLDGERVDFDVSVATGAEDALAQSMTVAEPDVPYASMHEPGGFFDVPEGSIGYVMNDWSTTLFAVGYTLSQDSYGIKHAVLWSKVDGSRIDLEDHLTVDYEVRWSVPHGPVGPRWVAVYSDSGQGGRTELVFVEELDWPVDINTQGEDNGIPDGVVTGSDLNYFVNRWIEATR